MWQFYDKNGALKQATAEVVNPMAKLTGPSNQALAATTYTTLTFDTTVYGTVPGLISGNTFVIQTAGKYRVQIRASTAGGLELLLKAVVNGGNPANIPYAGASLSANQPAPTYSEVLSLNVGDVVSAQAWLGSANNVSSKVFSIEKVDGVVYSTTKPPKITTSLLSGGPPSSPDDGDIWIATNVGASGERWKFQYDALEVGAYKWKFIGGSAVMSSIDTSEVGGGIDPAWADLTTVGPSFTIPRNGDYDFSFTALGSIPAIQASWFDVGLSIAGAVPIFVDIARNRWESASGIGGTVENTITTIRRKTGLAATSVVKLQYRVNAGSSSLTWFYRRLSVLPVRIS